MVIEEIMKKILKIVIPLLLLGCNMTYAADADSLARKWKFSIGAGLTRMSKGESTILSGETPLTVANGVGWALTAKASRTIGQRLSANLQIGIIGIPFNVKTELPPILINGRMSTGNAQLVTSFAMPQLMAGLKYNVVNPAHGVYLAASFGGALASRYSTGLSSETYNENDGPIKLVEGEMKANAVNVFNFAIDGAIGYQFKSKRSVQPGIELHFLQFNNLLFSGTYTTLPDYDSRSTGTFKSGRSLAGLNFFLSF